MTSLPMNLRRAYAAVLSVAAVGAFASAASAAPPAPSYTSSCVMGGSTTLNWKHNKKVAEVKFSFYTSNWGYIGSTDVSVPSSKRPNGQSSMTTPATAGHYSVAVRAAGDTIFYSVAHNLDCY